MRETHQAPPIPVLSDDFEIGIVRRFGDVVTARPDAIAVADARRTLTYRQLAMEAVAVREVVRATVGPTSPAGAGAHPIAVLHRHEAGAVAAILGVIASGHPLVVLDPHTPIPRLQQFIDQVGATACIADAASAGTARQITEHVIQPVTGIAAHGHRAQSLWAAPPPATAAALLAFTSGSTGVPKVVVCDHRQLLCDGWANGLGSGCYTADDVIAHTLPLAFYAGLLAALGVLTAGAQMRLHDVRAAGSGALLDWLRTSKATVLHTSPAILRGLVRARPDGTQLADLRSLTIAGEAAYAADLEAARHLLPPTCTVFNRYGSSETGLITDFRISTGDVLAEGPIPAGHPIGQTTLTLVEADGSTVTGDGAGTVAVTRRYLATGYWNNPQATAATFTDHPDGTRTCRTSDVGRFDADGTLRLLGRRDHSVKIGGFLVEPGEVDAVLFALPEVREAVTVGSTDTGRGRLTAYLVPATEQLSPAALRAALREQLPAHMVPGSIVFLDALPRTERGKLNRAALPAPPPIVTTGTGQDFSDWERVVADVWIRVLSLDDIGLDDDFFELGGDSLAAETLISAMVEELGVSSPNASTSVLVQAPTVREFSRRLTRCPQGADDVLIPVKPTGTRPPLFVVAGGGGLGVAFVPLAKRLDEDQPLWALQSHALERRGIPDWSVRAAARRNIKAIQRVQPQGPYHLAGHSFGGLVALEMAHQLRRGGHHVGLLTMLDSFPPDPSLHGGPSFESPVQRLRHTVGLALTGIRNASGLDQYWRFYRLSEWLHGHYKSKPWDGRTLVIVAQSPQRQERSQWDRHLTGDWSLVEVGGDHLSMIREPFVAETAKALTVALTAWSPTAGQAANTADIGQ